MAVAFLSTLVSMSAEQYDWVTKQLDASGSRRSAGMPISRLLRSR